MSSHCTASVTPMPTVPSSVLPSPTSAINAPILSALAAKRTELDARRSALSEQLAALDRELATLEGAMQLFASGGALQRQTPTTSNHVVRYALGLHRGELGHEAMSILRSAARPLTAQEVGHALCQRRQVTLDAPTFDRLCLLIVSNLRRREARGQVRSVGRTIQNAVLWIIAAPSAG